MDINRGGYYIYVKKLAKLKLNKDIILLTELKALNKQTRGSYGSRRISKGLKNLGYNVGRYKARGLMREAGIECKQRRRYKITTQSDHELKVAKNLLNREFTVPEPNRVWVTDITYISTFEGWLYVAAVLDLFSRRIVGWAMADHMREELVENALDMALGRRNPAIGLMHHSDRGVQYACGDYQAALKAANITVSMSRKGNCWDNAVMERFWGSLKSERTDHAKYFTRAQAITDIVNYIEMFYNNQRLHSTLNYISPVQFEFNYRKTNNRVDADRI